MAILWADGFDDWTIASGLAGEYEAYSANAITIQAAAGRRGGGCLQMNNFSDSLTKGLGSVYTELYGSVAFKPVAATGTGYVMQWQRDGTPLCTLRWNVGGSLSALSGSTAGTVLATSAAGLCPVGVFTHVQMRTVFATSGGIMQVRVNGKPALALDVTGNTGAGCNNLYLFVYGSTTNQYDDLVINDTSGTVANGWLGDVRVDSYRPNGNGDSAQMVGSDGNSTDNYQLVGGAAPGATYAQSATVGAEDLYQFSDLANAPSAIYGVFATASVLKDDVGTRGIKLRARSGAADAEGVEVTLGTSRVRAAARFEVDPSTGLPWTQAGFNSAQFGLKVSV